MKKVIISPTASIFFALLLGAIAGFLANCYHCETFIYQWIAPFGELFLRVLKFIAVPLIIFSLLNGFAALTNLSKLHILATKTAFAYICTTVVAASLGLLLVNLFRPGNWMTENTRNKILEQTDIKVVSEEEISSLQFVVDLIPALKDINMLSVILISLLFALAVMSIETPKRKLLADLFGAINEAIMKIIDYTILYLAPIGVFALIAEITLQTPSYDLVYALLGYGLTVVFGLGILVFCFYPLLVSKFAKIPYYKFLKAILPAQMLAISTSSSAATLPLTMECAEQNLELKKEVIGFVLPIGATLNMDGTALYQAIAALFIAQVFGTEITVSEQLVIVLMATASSIGSAAVPSGGIIMLTAILAKLGISSEGLALILILDRPLDMLRSATNITSDLAISAVIDKIDSDY